MNHSPLQRDLAIRCADEDVARRRLAELAARKREVQARVHELGNAAGAARDELRSAAGAHAAGEGDAKSVEKARKALKEAESDHELAEIELQGIAERVELAEREHRGKVRDRNLIGTDVCQIAATVLEEQARATLARFAQIMRERHALAKLAAELSTEAAGHVCEPIRYSDERAGLLGRGPYGDDDLRALLMQHGISTAFGPLAGLEPATLASLLELELPPAAEAAE